MIPLILRGNDVSVTGGYSLTNDCHCRAGAGCGRTGSLAAPPVAVAPPPPPPSARGVRDELRDRMLELRERCEEGEHRACVRLGIIIGENRERRAAWRREHPEVFFYESER